MNLPRMPEAVVFDMDGLLFNTESLYQDAFLAAAAELGHDTDLSVFRSLIGTPWITGRGVLLSHYGEAFAVDAFLVEWLRHFDLMLADRLAMKAGVTELLATLDELAIPKAIATSSSHETVHRHLAAHGLVGRFDQIVASGDYARVKPAPDPFLLAAARLGVEPELCLALEDSYHGVRSACSAGMMTIMVPDLLEPTDEISRLCAFVVRDLHEVRRMLIQSTGRSS